LTGNASAGLETLLVPDLLFGRPVGLTRVAADFVLSSGRERENATAPVFAELNRIVVGFNLIGT